MKKIAFMLVMLMGGVHLFAQEGDEGYPGAIFEVGSARSTGIGNTFVALADAPEAVFFNPAGLGKVNYSNLSLLGSSLRAGAVHSIVSFTMPWATYGTFGLTYTGVFGRVTDVKDTLGIPTPGVTAGVTMSGFLLSYGKKFGFISAGISPKLIFNTLWNTQALGFDVDIGTIFYPLKLIVPKFPYDMVALGLTVKNILGSGLTYEKEKEHLPRVIKSGVALKFMEDRFSIAADFSLIPWDTITVSKYSGGFEIVPVRNFTLRAGVNKNTFNAGFGLKWELTRAMGLNLDYAVVANHRSEFIVGLIHKLSFEFALKNIGGIWVDVSPGILKSPIEYANIFLHGVAPFHGKTRRWEFLIKDREGNIRYRTQRDVYTEVDELPSKITWNGIDNIRGGQVPSDKYYYEIKITDKLGDEIKYSGYLMTVKWGE